MRAILGSQLLSTVILAASVVATSPAHANTSTAFPTGSLIIPTSSAFQDDCGSMSAYGLVYNVLRANPWLSANGYTPITIFYTYLDTKASPNRCVPTTLDTAPTVSALWNDGCDIMNVGAQQIDNADHNAATTAIVTYNNTSKSNVYPKYPSRTLSGAAKVNYLGGPFVILPSDAVNFRKLLDNTITAQDVNGNTIDFSAYRTHLGTQALAPTSACTIGTDHYVNIHRSTTAFIANIGKAFQAVPPRLALLATDKNVHTSTVSNSILQGYLTNAGLNYTGANGCPPASVQAANAAVCPSGAVSGQIYDSFDFDDIVNNQLAATSAGNPLYTMFWTPHWEITRANRMSCVAGSGGTCVCTANCTSCTKIGTTGTCSVVAGSTVPGPPNANEQNALGKISAFLDSQTGLAAECASVTSYEGDYNGGVADTRGVPQFQTCLDNGAGACAATGTPWGIERAPTSATTTSNSRNCSDPNLVAGSKCVFYSYPGDSFAQTGDYSWSAVTGHTQTWLPNAAVSSIYKPGVVPLISEVASLDTTKIVTPSPYTGSASAAQTAARPMIVSDLTTRSVKDNTAGKANILYLAGHDQRTSVAGTRVMLETLLQLGISTLPPIVTVVEVSRNSPIAATIDGNASIVQGTFEFVTSSSTTITVPTFSADSDSATFRFPFTHGHLRARTTGSITTTASGFNMGTAVFDAAGGIPDANYVGCSTYYTALCRTVFTTTTQGTVPPMHYLQQSEAATLGPLMGAGLTSGNQELVIERVLAGDDSLIPGFFRPALGGVDRSTVAIIDASPLVNSTRPQMAYFGADDGMLHAVCMSVAGPCDIVGRELWAYLPRTQLSTVRYNTGRIDGSPHVIDSFGDFTQSGQRKWSTLLFFTTGTGDTTGNDRKPAVYGLDISDPTLPKVIWEYSLADVGSLAAFEPGVGLTLSAGRIQTGVTTKTLVFAQTNNAGTAGSGDVLTAINAETGQKEWQAAYAFTTSLRTGGTSIPSLTGIPGGAVAVDKTGNGFVTDVVWGTLYGDVWRADPITGISKDGAGKPLFRFSTDNHPIGAKPAIYAKGGIQYAVVTTGGYVDSYPSDTNWSPAGTINYVLGISLNTPIVDATIAETKGTPDIPFKFAFGANEKGLAQATVVNSQIYVTTDTADTNDNTNPGAYGTGGATGHVYRIDFSPTTATIGAAVVVEGGATSVINSGLGVYSGSSDQQVRLATDAVASTATSVDPNQTSKVVRKLWLRTQ